MKNDRIALAFEKWKDRSSKEYIKAICKPCWELKYCPYGVLVENFPLGDVDDDVFKCRIFGHICPVFKVAEPLTETKELRNISRNIPNAVKYKVLRRDKYTCQLCGKNVPDAEINFDHIIPWSKGGASDAANIRLLCEQCNKKRGNNFESEHLVAHMQEVFAPPTPVRAIHILDLLRLFSLATALKKSSIGFFVGVG